MGSSARRSPPCRELLSCAALEHRGRSLAAHLVLSAPAEPRGEGACGARWRGPVPDICCQLGGRRGQEGTGVRQWRMTLEPAGC